MVSTVAERGAIAAEDERPALAELERLLTPDAGGSGRLLIGTGGEQIPLPDSVLLVLRQVVRALAADRAVEVVSVPRLLTLRQAAGVLAVREPYLLQLLDDGAIPAVGTGRNRRVPLDDLLAYRRRRDAGRREGLARLTQMSEELGLYE